MLTSSNVQLRKTAETDLNIVFFKGVCDTFDGVCQCSPGYTGDNCSTKTGLLLVCTGWDGSSNTDTCEVIDPIQEYGNMGCRVFKIGISNKVVRNGNFYILLMDFVPSCQKVLKSD